MISFKSSAVHTLPDCWCWPSTIRGAKQRFIFRPVHKSHYFTLARCHLLPIAHPRYGDRRWLIRFVQTHVTPGSRAAREPARVKMFLRDLRDLYYERRWMKLKEKEARCDGNPVAGNEAFIGDRVLGVCFATPRAGSVETDEFSGIR